MPCFKPQTAFKKPGGGITFIRSQGWKDLTPLSIPCGQCIGCRLDRASNWATRIRHEASCHQVSSFLTLTYDNDHLPDDYSVSVRELQLFNKRMRKAMGSFRFFACGEYGDEGLRPHYHMILFGHDFSGDRQLWRQTSTGFLTYRSARLETLWTAGHAEIGSVTTESAGYVARYCLKKINGQQAEEHYQRLHPLTGEIVTVRPEFITHSTGIGREWIKKYKGDVFPSDYIILDGKKRPVPRYYKNKFAEAEQERVLLKRIAAARPHKANNTPERLAVREELQQIRAARLKRDLK